MVNGRRAEVSVSRRQDWWAYRRMRRAFLRPGYLRPFWLFVALLFVLIAGRIALTPKVDAWARQVLNHHPVFQATYGDLSLFSYPPAAVFENAVITTPDGQELLVMQRLEVHTTWKEMFRLWQERGKVSAPPKVWLRLVEPTLTTRRGQPVRALEHVQAWLRGAPAATVEATGIVKGRVVIADEKGQTRECLRDLNASFERFEIPRDVTAATDIRNGGKNARRLVGFIDVEACRQIGKPAPGVAHALNQSAP
jgi:hypothetical protein